MGAEVVPMAFLYFILIKLLDIYTWLLIANVMVSWLVAFDVLNIRNGIVNKACRLLDRIVDPPMARLRKFVPPVGGIDFTPMAMLFGIYLIQNLLYNLIR